VMLRHVAPSGDSGAVEGGSDGDPADDVPRGRAPAPCVPAAEA
jgi:hypothetical protein